jgi:hypothetical protein
MGMQPCWVASLLECVSGESPLVPAAYQQLFHFFAGRKNANLLQNMLQKICRARQEDFWTPSDILGFSNMNFSKRTNLKK